MWKLIEDWGFLPAISDPNKPDLRFILEHTEVSAKSYPTTDGFLALLSALFTYGSPAALGYETRCPGVLIYLEYVLYIIRKAPHWDYIILAERWRLTARALQIFRDVLSMYPITELHAYIRGGELSTEFPEDLQKQIRYDFTKDSESKMEKYPMGFGRAYLESPRPKTVGFTLMTWLLNGGELVDYIFSILRACSPLITERTDYVPSAVEMALTILCKTYRDSGVIRDVDLGRDLHLDGFDDVDLAYWQQAAVTTAIGLLSDCLKRESAFLDCVSAAGCQLHTTPSGGTRQTMVPGEKLTILSVSRSTMI